jgi:hypothetical protein
MPRPMKGTLVGLTTGALITLRPTQLEKMFLTSFFGPKPILKCQERHFLLEMNRA